MAAKAKTRLPPGEYDVLKALIERGGDKTKVATVDLDKGHLNALKARKGFIDADEVKQGRGTTVTSAKVLVKLDDFERAPNRQPRSGGASPATRAPRNGPARGTVAGIPASALPLNHADVRRYLEAVTPAAQRAYEQRKQAGLTDVEVARVIKGLSGPALLAKLREFEMQSREAFDEYLRREFPTELITILGIPPVGPDTPDEKPQPRADRDVPPRAPVNSHPGGRRKKR
jgi:hypothetical protein